MPVYASTSGFGAHRRHPSALMLIVGGHAVLIAAVMTAKMTMPPIVPDPPIIIDSIKLPPDPPPVPEPPVSKEPQAAAEVVALRPADQLADPDIRWADDRHHDPFRSPIRGRSSERTRFLTRPGRSIRRSASPPGSRRLNG